MSEELDEGFLEAFAKIKQRDASIYDANAKLFHDIASTSSEEDASAGSDSESDGGHKPRSRQKSTPKYLRQVLAEQALEGGSDSNTDDTTAERPRTYNQEQQDVKSAFLEAAGEAGQELEDGEFGQVLKKRPARAAGGPQADLNKPVIKELLVKCFDPKENPEDAFLRDFVQGQQWRDDDDTAVAADVPKPLDEADADLEGDQQYLQEADRFEASFNFRFEEPGSAHAVTHPRVMEGSVRKKDERRKQARERKAKRQEQELRRQQEEAKRARNAAKANSGDKRSELEQVREAAGGAGPDAAQLQALMDSEDWDPDAYDAAMQSAFGEDYYEAADEMGEGEEGDGGEYDEAQPVGRDQPGNDGNEGEEEDAGAPPAAASGFRYRPVPKQDYGLDIVDLLQLDAKELNQVVGLKRLAPYREERGRQYANTRKLQELRQAKQETRPHKPAKPRPMADFKAKRRKQRPAALANGSAAAASAEGQHSAVQPGKKTGKPILSDAAAAAGQAPADEATMEAAQPGGKPKKRKVKAAAVKTTAGDGAAAPTAPPAVDAEAAGDADAKTKAVAKAERERARRLQSYGKLTLRPDSGSKGAKRKAPEEPSAADGQSPAGDGLTRGERKRLKRSMRRAQKREGAGPQTVQV